MPQISAFADALSGYNEAKFVIFGVPFDMTSSFRMGSRFAPNRIREESHNFEPYIFEHKVDLLDVPVHDAGNLDESGSVRQMLEDVEFASREIAVSRDKFQIMLGGEHSITPPSVKAHITKYPGLAVLQLDAHLDFRNSYLDEPNSHACALRRSCDIVGTKSSAAIGVRSISAEEWKDLKGTNLNYITASEVNQRGIVFCLNKTLRNLGNRKIYLSLDIDCIDPAYAPGTGTPEPFGLNPLDIKYVIDQTAPRLVAFDLVEVCPPYDNGNTSALAARLVREVIASVWKARCGTKPKKLRSR